MIWKVYIGPEVSVQDTIDVRLVHRTKNETPQLVAVSAEARLKT